MTLANAATAGMMICLCSMFLVVAIFAIRGDKK